MTRTDDMPVKYHKDENGEYLPVVDQKAGKQRHWNLSKLNSRENPLVLFTLLAQGALGTFMIPFIGALAGIEMFTQFTESNFFLPLVILSIGMTSLGLLMSVTHLGKPFRFYRGFNNLRYSPMSREGLGLALFSAFMGLSALFLVPSNEWMMSILQGTGVDNLMLNTLFPWASVVEVSGVLASVSGAVGLYYMNQCYQIKARPFWHHWQTASSFVGNSLSIGAMVSGVLVLIFLNAESLPNQVALEVLGAIFLLGLVLEALGLKAHNHTLNRSENEGGAAHYVQCTTFGKTYLLRNALLGFNILAASGLLIYANVFTVNEPLYLAAWIGISLMNIVTALIGRALFYNLVIPTTMPGAFFWKNKGFEQHARDIGLADNPATGVIPTSIRK